MEVDAQKLFDVTREHTLAQLKEIKDPTEWLIRERTALGCCVTLFADILKTTKKLEDIDKFVQDLGNVVIHGTLEALAYYEKEDRKVILPN